MKNAAPLRAAPLWLPGSRAGPATFEPGRWLAAGDVGGGAWTGSLAQRPLDQARGSAHRRRLPQPPERSDL